MEIVNAKIVEALVSGLRSLTDERLKQLIYKTLEDDIFLCFNFNLLEEQDKIFLALYDLSGLEHQEDLQIRAENQQAINFLLQVTNKNVNWIRGSWKYIIKSFSKLDELSREKMRGKGSEDNQSK